VNREIAIDLLDRLLHEAENDFCAGGSGATWSSSCIRTSPGPSLVTTASPIRTGVLSSCSTTFAAGETLADRTFQINPQDALVGEGDRIAAGTHGLATIRGVQHGWTIVRLYGGTEGQTAACWLLRLDQRAFDGIWSLNRHASRPLQQTSPEAKRRSIRDADA
jgi:hypothetical protein